MRRAHRPASLAVALVSILALAAVTPAQAQCSYPFLTSGSAVHYGAGTVLYPTIVQSSIYWSAVAVRPDPGTDWDLSLNGTATTYPNCVTNVVATSQLGGSAVDVVIGDFNHNPTGTYYARPYLFSGPGGATVEWDDGPDRLEINAPWISRTTGASDVVECWDVYLEAGKRYYFNLLDNGDASLRMLFFQSPGTTYWAGRSGATYETPPISNGSLSVSFLASATDWYGIVIINENGQPADYKVDVTTCVPPTVLASATPVHVTSPERQYSFVQSSNSFSAIGVRPDNQAEDWGMRIYEGPYDVTYGNCLRNLVAGSLFSPDKTEYMVGDFNAGANATGVPNFATAIALSGAAGGAQVEWDEGPEPIVVDAPLILGTTDASDVLACWQVELVDGNSYDFHFEHTGDADLKLGVFRNDGGVYWVPRSDALEEHGSSFIFNATSSDWHGVVVANDNGLEGNYELGVYTPAVGVGDLPALSTRLEGVAPNPVVRGSHIRYALRDAGEVRFDVLNAAGRRVSRITDGTRAPGHWSATWSGTNEDGRRLGAGVYFLRMLVDGRVVEGAKVVLLP